MDRKQLEILHRRKLSELGQKITKMREVGFEQQAVEDLESPPHIWVPDLILYIYTISILTFLLSASSRLRTGKMRESCAFRCEE